MAVTALVPGTDAECLVLALDTRSGDMPIASWKAIATGAEGFTVDLSAYNGYPVVLGFEDNAGCTITMTQGARPPAQRRDLLSVSTTEMPAGRKITLAANDVRFITIDPSRFLDADGLIAGISSTDTTTMVVMILPRNWAT